MWPHRQMAINRWTVSTWKSQRFNAAYPGYDVDVLDGSGNAVAGNTLLSNVRNTYSGG